MHRARPQGTTGGVIEVDGKQVDVVDPDAPAHTFAVPELGVFVPGCRLFTRV